MLTRWPFKSRPKRRGHPTPEQALDALQAGEYMYKRISNRIRPPRGEGLRDTDDVNAVLVCGRTTAAFARCQPRNLDRLERVLLAGFRRPVDPLGVEAE